MGACCGGAQNREKQNPETVILTNKGNTENMKILGQSAIQQVQVIKDQNDPTDHQINQDKPKQCFATNEIDQQQIQVKIEQNNNVQVDDIPLQTIKITIIYGKQTQILEGINQHQTVQDLKLEIIGWFQDSIKKSQRLTNYDDFFLYHNDQCLKPTTKLLDYKLNNEELRLYGLITIKIVKSVDKKTSWGKKTLLTQTWYQLKEKMAAELSIEPSKIEFLYKGTIVNNTQKLYENNLVDQDEVILKTE